MRTARNMALWGIAMAAPYLAIGFFWPGAFGSKLIGSGLIVLVATWATAAWLWSRGKRADQEQDERERAIFSNAARATLMTMAVVITGYYAWRFSIVGPDEPSFWLVAVGWGTFAVAYIYSRIRM